VVIPNWNGAPHLGPLLEALRNQTLDPFETIVIDNASSDGSRERLAATSVQLLCEEVNTGFARAVNRGVRAATTEFVMLLNNDMFPEPSFLAELLGAADERPESASFAAKVVFRDRPSIIDSTGDRLLRSGRARGIGRDQPDGACFDEARWVFGATAGAALWRRQVYLDLGGLDGDFFAYVEDTDLSLRAQLAGWRCRYVPTAVARHVGSASLSDQEDVRAQLCLRNYVFFLSKVYPGHLLLRNSPNIVVALVREVAFAFRATRARHGAARASAATASSVAQAVIALPRMLAKRRTIARRAAPPTIEELNG